MRRVLAALRLHPELIVNQPELAELRAWAEQHGAHFPIAHAQPDGGAARRGNSEAGSHSAEANHTSSSSSSEHDDSDEEDEEEEEVSEHEPESESEPDTDLWEVEPLADEPAEPATAADAEAGEVSEEVEEQAMSLKAEATELASDPDSLPAAIDKMTAALQLVPHNSMYWGLRALYQLRAKRAAAALRDADRALHINAQNVRALRVRGTVRRHMGDYENALTDLKNAQSIDYDEATDATMKYVQTRVSARQRRAVRRRNAEERRAERQAAAAARRRQAAHRRSQAAYEAAHKSAQAGHPSMHHDDEDAEEDNIYGSYGGGAQAPRGGGAAFPPGLGTMFSDPELMAAMQNPEVSSKLMAALQNPASMASLMQDPKVGPLLTKLMSKMGGMGMGTPPPHQQQQQQQSHPRAQPPQPASMRPTDDLD